jgi:hypothetical protein
MPVLHTYGDATMRQPRRRCPGPGTMVLCTYDAALPPARARSLSLKPPHSAASFLSVRADRPLACTRAARDSDVYSCGVDLNRPGPLESLSLGSTRKKKKNRNLTGRVASACNHALLRGRKKLLLAFNGNESLERSQLHATDRWAKREGSTGLRHADSSKFCSTICKNNF